METDENDRRRSINKTVKQIRSRSTTAVRPTHTVLLE